MSFCHHLTSIVLSFHIKSSPLETPWPNGTKLGMNIYGNSSVTIAQFHPNPLTNMAAIGYSCFWLVDFYKSSLKPLC